MKIVFATHNQNKFREVKAIMPPHIELLSLAHINCNEDIPETSDTIEGNAIQKAKYVKEHYGYDCFADDTGLEVVSLNNEPGVYSARYAGPENAAQANMEKLLFNLSNKGNRNARFKTAISLINNGKEELFVGVCEGEITLKPRGEEGFGYDPIFQPKGFESTFAEMPLALKSKIGHRGNAIRLLVDFLAD